MVVLVQPGDRSEEAGLVTFAFVDRPSMKDDPQSTVLQSARVRVLHLAV